MQEERDPNTLPTLPLEKDEKAKHRSGAALFLSGLALLLTLLNFGMQYFFWRLNSHTQDVFRQELQREQQNVVPVISRLTNQVAQQQQTLATLAVKLRSDDRRNQVFTAQEAEHLLTISQYYLLFDNNLDLVTRLLTTAEQKLQELNDPELDSVRKELANVLITLNALPKVNTSALIGRLTAIGDQITTLTPLPTPIKAQATPLAMQSLTWKEKILATLYHLRDIVTIRRLNEPVKPLASLEQQAYLTEFMRLQLSQAQWAVMHQELGVYRQSLQEIQKSLNHYYSHNVQAMSLIRALAALQQIDIKPKAPDLSKLINLLHTYIQNSQQNLNASLERAQMSNSSANSLQALPS